LTFSGPTGYAYPQFRPEVDSFDDTIRTEPKARLEIDDDAKIKDPIATIPEANESKYVEPPKVEGVQLPPAEFTDDEIVAAFKFIDLDHNNYVGASEIRHILVCMGELVTDEEIDMMISMVDLDGDGQVSFTEFKTLVLHPNPGMVDIITKVGIVKEEANQEEKNMLTGYSLTYSLTHSPTHSLTHSLTHLTLTHSLTHLTTYSLTHLTTYSGVRGQQRDHEDIAAWPLLH
jgi:hypothetical protein